MIKRGSALAIILGVSLGLVGFAPLQQAGEGLPWWVFLIIVAVALLILLLIVVNVAGRQAPPPEVLEADLRADEAKRQAAEEARRQAAETPPAPAAAPETPAPAPAAPAPAEEAAVAKAEPAAEAPAVEAPAAEVAEKSAPDDLRRVEGIGPKIAQLLGEAGIETFARLADTEVARLQEILAAAGSRFRLADPSTWPQQARLAAAGEWDKLASFQENLKGGRLSQ